VRLVIAKSDDSFSQRIGRAFLAGRKHNWLQPGRLRGVPVAFLVVGLSSLAGCGSGETTIKVTPPAAAVQLRSTLEQIGEAGVIDSSVAYAQQLAEEIAAEDSSKSQLIAETEKLSRARGKTAINKQVAEILKLLD
jgi:hypothetical protein